MKIDDGSGPNGSVIHYSQTGFRPAEPRELPIGDYDTCKISKRSTKPGALSCSKHVAGAYLIASRFCCFNSGGLSWTLQAMDDYSISTACGFHKKPVSLTLMEKKHLRYICFHLQQQHDFTKRPRRPSRLKKN